MMRQYILAILLLTTTAYAQKIVKIHIPEIDSTAYLYQVLLNDSKTYALLDINNPKEQARKAHFYLLDLKNHKLACKFSCRRWTYLHDAFFHENKYIYISFGIRLRTKYYIYDINTGERVGKKLAKNSPVGESYSAGVHVKNHSSLANNELVINDIIIKVDPEKKFIRITDY